MPNPQLPAKSYKVVHRTLGDSSPVEAGVIAIDGEHRISVISVGDKSADLLRLAARTLNASDTFMVRAAPRPGDQPLTLRKRPVARTAPDAGEAVIELLRKNYGFELTPAD